MSQTRQFAAIMFTDLVGYTALMGEDGGRAFGLFNKNRQQQKITSPVLLIWIRDSQKKRGSIPRFLRWRLGVVVVFEKLPPRQPKLN